MINNRVLLEHCFLLFAGQQFYPEGGMQDFIGHFQNIESAQKEAMRKDCNEYEFDWAHIVNIMSYNIVLSGDCFYETDPSDRNWEWN